MCYLFVFRPNNDSDYDPAQESAESESESSVSSQTDHQDGDGNDHAEEPQKLVLKISKQKVIFT